MAQRVPELQKLLLGNSYPGRGICVGMSPDGQHVMSAYFIMGRSENSRNRVFYQQGQHVVKTRAYDESRMVDPSLIIYAPVRRLRLDPTSVDLIVTNGDQTDTIRDALVNGGTFEGALRTRTFEPDPPNYTPRISALCRIRDGKAAFQMGILKSDRGNPEVTLRQFFEWDGMAKGEGVFLHTYVGDGNPLPSFEGEPEKVKVGEDLKTWTNEIWESLDRDNKISLFTCAVSLKDGTWQTLIVNRHEMQG
ncbi:MAG: inosine monophosphate cyclohydrolase [Clostridia bacterium]|nr:inosine monophosphate cyclohydrolase [Clostridia bacterium]